MGYESRLYIIRKSENVLFKKYKYAEVMAIYEMSVFPPFQKLFEECSITEFTVYNQCARGCESPVTVDQYGEFLKEASIEDVLDCLAQFLTLKDNAENYTRIIPLKAMLEEFKKQNNQDRLAVLHYGY